MLIKLPVKIFQIVYIIVAILALNSNLLSQNIELKLEYKYQTDGSVDFYYSKAQLGSVTIRVTFKDLRNAFYTEYPMVVKGTTGRLFTLKPSDEKKSIQFSYSYTYINGALNPRINEDLIYILPFKMGTSVKVQEMSNAGNSFFGSDVPEGWRAYQFKTESIDSVFAARKGIVIRVESAFEIDTISYFNRNKNLVTIEHPDGTMATYKGFVKDGIFVKPGDQVLPQAPIGLIRDEKMQSKLSFTLYYLSDVDFEKKNKETVTNKTSFYKYLTPKFYTEKGIQILESGKSYSVNYSLDIITKEMTKKEKKNYSK